MMSVHNHKICGCVVSCLGDAEHEPRIQYCALHVSAPEMLVLLRLVNCHPTLHMSGQPFVAGCPGCEARALLSKIRTC